MDDEHPGYGFAEHKGYSTAAHSSALVHRGPCSQHRRSFINVARVAPVRRNDGGWDKMSGACDWVVHKEKPFRHEGPLS
jgi:hypothetical protein